MDGLDGCGKDSHAARIEEAVADSGREVAVLRHPSDGFLGRVSKLAVPGSGPLPLAIAIAFYTMDVLRSVLRYNRARDGVFIFVRYFLGTAYLPPGPAHMAYALFRRLLPFPDLALFIDIEPSVAIRRIEQREHKREMFETGEKLTRISNVARTLAKEEWVAIGNSIDGERPFLNTMRVLSERPLT